MKNLKHLILFVCIAATTNISYGSAQTNLYDYVAHPILRMISLPTKQAADPLSSSIFKKIDTAYGKTGMNILEDEIELIKKTYLYLIFLAKAEKAKNNPQFSQYQSDFQSFFKDNNQKTPHFPTAQLINSNGWKAIPITEKELEASTAWQLLCKSMITDSYTYDFTAINVIHNIDKQIFNFIPHIETSYYDQDFTNIRTMAELTRVKIILQANVKDQYIKQCDDWKNLPLTHNTKKSPTQSSQQTIGQAVVQFRKEPFYQTTHNLKHLTTTDPQQTITRHDLIAGSQLKSPLKEYVWAYCMVREIQVMVYSYMNEDNVGHILTQGSSSGLQPNFFEHTVDDFILLEDVLAAKSKFAGTHTKSKHPSPPLTKIEDIRPKHSLINPHRSWAMHAQDHVTEEQMKDHIAKNAVKVQSWFSHAFHSITHIAEDTGDAISKTSVFHAAEGLGTDFAKAGQVLGKVGILHDLGHDIEESTISAFHGIEVAAKTAEHLSASAALGLVGLGAKLVGQQKFGDKLTKEAMENLAQGTKDLQNSIDSFGKAIEDGVVAPTAELSGKLVGFVLDDKKIGEDMSQVMNHVADALVEISAKVTYGLNAEVLDIGKLAMRFTNLLVDSVAAAAGSHAAQEDFMDTLKSIAYSYKGLMSLGKTELMTVMQGLGAIINSLTTLVIDVSREMTYLVLSGRLFMNMVPGGIVLDLATRHVDMPGNTSAKKISDHATNTLEAHRHTINQVMGFVSAIAACAALDVCTAGAGTAADPEIAAAITGAAETAGEGTAVTTEVLATDAAATDAAVTDAAATDAAATDAAATDATGAGAGAEGSTITATNALLTGLKGLGIAMNIAFGFFGTVGGVNKDDKAIAQQEREEEHIANLWNFVNENTLAVSYKQLAYLKELEKKQQAEIGNQLLKLTFSQNLQYSAVDKLAQEISSILAKHYITLLSPDKNNLLPADTGTNWGIQSPYLNLYPSQGFPTTTTGRADFPFAQEVAQEPLSTHKQKISTRNKKYPIEDKLWFNQKVIGLDNTTPDGLPKQPIDPLTVSIDMEFIYTLKSAFHAGLYLGGQYHDYYSSDYRKQLVKSQSVDINTANLAKMIVLFREKTTDPLYVGIYEHQGKGWITKEKLPASMQLDIHHTYHIKASLDKDKLTVQISTDNNTTSWKKSFTVTKIANQRTYGIIYSGAAIQWNQSYPKYKNIVNKQARPSSNRSSATEKEKAFKKQISLIQHPDFGSISLKPVNKHSLLSNQYVYVTMDTNLPKTGKDSLGDFVLFATYEQEHLNNIGNAPTGKSNEVIISLITGNVYDKTGKIVTHQTGTWSQYKKLHGPISDQIDTYITTTRNQLLSSLQNITFGSFKLDVINSEALSKGQYIYTGMQTLKINSMPTKDFLILVTINDKKLGETIGLPPTSSKANGLLSLVTGKLYDKKAALSTDGTLSSVSDGYYDLMVFENQYGQIDDKDLFALQSTQKQYEQSLEKKPSKLIPLQPVKTISSSPSSSQGFGSASGFSFGSPGTTDVTLFAPDKSSFSQLQINAAGTSGFQLNRTQSTGIHLSV